MKELGESCGHKLWSKAVLEPSNLPPVPGPPPPMGDIPQRQGPRERAYLVPVPKPVPRGAAGRAQTGEASEE